VGERQPVVDSAGRFHLLFDGRLDNRDELLAALGRPHETAASDAAIALWAFEAWSEDGFGRLLGPFAVAVYDAVERRVSCARDPLGDRTLFYRSTPRLLLVASEEQALLAHPEVSDRLDEETLARFYAVAAAAPGSTFFADVRELLPGELLTAGPEGTRTRRFARVGPADGVHFRRDSDYAERFAELLAEAVRCRLRATAPPAVLMSGGLDSTTVAALAARELAAAGDRRPLGAISWVFDELPQADEREFMDPMVEAFGLRAVRIAGDDAWPLSDPPSWPRNPVSPLEGIYRRLLERSYAAVRGEGGRVLLTGEFGDQLYSGSSHWLRDLLAEGRWVAAGGEVLRELRWAAATRRSPRPGLRTAAARALGVRRRRTVSPPPWLTPHALSRIEVPGADPAAGLAGWRRPEQARSLLDWRSANAASLEVANAARAGVEVRRPFRDRRLVEFVAAVPGHVLYRPGWPRWILRRAMAGVLPEPVRRRRRISTLLPLCARGLVEREAPVVEALLGSPEAVWPRYVRRDWLAAAFPHRLRAGLDGVESVVPWRCLCGEIWLNHGILEEAARGRQTAG
jgi:asparagine synthase (glutamine-hydrolysing)